jgi:cytochrome P450 family 6
METLRMATPLGVVVRTCTRDYTLPGTQLRLKANDMVSISSSGIHSDPRYYPNPDTFNPDNFSKEARHHRSPYVIFSLLGENTVTGQIHIC